MTDESKGAVVFGFTAVVALIGFIWSFFSAAPENPSPCAPHERPDVQPQRDNDVEVRREGPAEFQQEEAEEEAEAEGHAATEAEEPGRNTTGPDGVELGEVWQPLDNPLEHYMPEGRRFENYNIAIMGPQGVGKTTLVTDMRVLAGFCATQWQAMGFPITGGVELSSDEMLTLEQTLNATATEQAIMDARQDLINNGEDVDRPGIHNDNRDPTPWFISEHVTLWDMPGAGTVTWPTDTVVEDMGLAQMSAVVVMVGLHEHEVINDMIAALHKARIPVIVVQTHFDDYVEKKLNSDFLAWMTDRKGSVSQFWAQADVKALIQQRRQEVRKIYDLQARDHVHCVNLCPQPDFGGTGAPRTMSFELSIMRKHIFDVAKAAHQYSL